MGQVQTRDPPAGSLGVVGCAYPQTEPLLDLPQEVAPEARKQLLELDLVLNKNGSALRTAYDEQRASARGADPEESS